MTTVALSAEESSHSSLTSFLKGSAFSACGLGIAGVLTMLTGVIFARWLKPEWFGIYSLVLAVVTFGAGFGAFGMDFTVARYVCYYLGTGEKSLIRSVVKYTLRRAIWISAALAVALFAVLRGGLLTGTKLMVLAPFAGCVALVIPAMAVQMVLLQAILAMQAVRTRVVLEKVLYPLLRLLLPFGLLWLFHDKTMAAVAGVLLSALLLTAVSAVVLRGRLRPLPASAPATSPVAKEWSGYALPYVFFSLQNFVSAGMGIDVLLVSALASVSESGIYAAAFRFTVVLLLSRAAMDYSFGPKVGRLYGESNFKAIASLYKTSSKVGMAWTLPFAVILIFFSEALMTKFFGPSYGRGGTALALLVVGFAADGAAGCNVTLLSMIGKPWLVLLNGLGGGVLTVGLCCLLIPRYGMVGAACAVTVARCVATGMGTFEIWRIHGLHPFSRSLVKPLLATFLAGVLSYVCKQQFQASATPSFFMLSAAISFVLLGYAATLRLSRFSIQSY